MTDPIVAEFYGGPLNKQISRLRQLSLMVHAEGLDLQSSLDDSDPMMPMPRQIANYELVRGPDNVPARDGGGRYLYRFKGYRHV